MKIKNIALANNLLLAPMAGVSDVGMRHVASLFGAGATVTEMVSAKALVYNSKKTEDMLHSYEVPPTKKVVQLFGHEPNVMADACLHPALKHFDWIDINFGCPASKIVKNTDGSALMKNPALSRQIVEACVQKSNKPISVKIRKGFYENDNTATDFAKMCQDAGASLVTVHGRTSAQGYAGNADYNAIAAVKNALSIPVVGNGDVVDALSYARMLQTGADGVMIGRGALGKPWIFAELQNNPTIMTKYQAIAKHIEVLRNFHTDHFIITSGKKHLLWALTGVKHSAEIKRALAVCNNVDEALAMLKTAFEQGE